MSDKTIKVQVMETLEHHKTIQLPMVCPECGADFSEERVGAWEVGALGFRYQVVEQEGEHILDPDTATLAGDSGGESMAVVYTCGRCEHVLHASNERELSDDEWEVANMAIALLATEPARGATKTIMGTQPRPQFQGPPERMHVVVVREHRYGLYHESATLYPESQVNQAIAGIAKEMSSKYPAKYAAPAVVADFEKWIQMRDGHMLRELWNDRFLKAVTLEVLACEVPPAPSPQEAPAQVAPRTNPPRDVPLGVKGPEGDRMQQLKQLVLFPGEDITTITDAEAVKRARNALVCIPTAARLELLMSPYVPTPAGGGAAPLQAMSAEEAARARPAFKQALPSLAAALKHLDLDKEPLRAEKVLLSAETARSFGMNVPNDADAVEVEGLRMGDHVAQAGRCIDVALWYPDHPTSLNAVKVSLVDVRAADSILVSYDKERDGWSVKQASTFQWEHDDQVCDPDWQEVAFVQAWGREKTSKVSAYEPEPEE